jgi:hypothetical protein
MSDAEAQTITTEAGPLVLQPASQQLLERITSLWQLGTARGLAIGDERGAEASGQLHLLRFKYIEIPESLCPGLSVVHQQAIAAGLVAYAKEHSEGLLAPSTYLRQKEDEKAEPGMAFFIVPDRLQDVGAKVGPSSPDTSNSGGHQRRGFWRRILGRSREIPDPPFDAELGVGAWACAMEMFRCVTVALQDFPDGLPKVIDIGLRPSSRLGQISVQLLACDSQLVCITEGMTPATADSLVRSGVERIASISFDDLTEAPKRPG